MASTRGWIRVDRSLLDHWIWTEKPFSKGQAWIDLIGLANYEDGEAVYRGKKIICKRGVVNRSIAFLARRWGWSRNKTRLFLRLLESDNMVSVNWTANGTSNGTGNRTPKRTGKRTGQETAITIVNYSKFQDLPATKRTPQRTPKRDTKSDTNSDINSDNEKTNNNKDKQIKENIASPFEGIDPDDMDDETYYKWQKWRVENGLI